MCSQEAYFYESKSLSVETSQLGNVPWISVYFASIWVLEAIGSAWNRFCDDVGSLPWGLQLLMALLSAAEHEVSFNEGSAPHSATVIAA